MRRSAVTIEEKFADLDKPEGQCWIWKWAANGAGRASFRGKSAPRAVYEMANRCSVHPAFGVLHSCDNPLCVNPDHLRVGTQKDNMRECSQKGRRSPNSRQRPGEDHSLARITWDDVREIRRMAGDGVQIKDIAKQFPISCSQVGRIVHNLRWREEHAAR